MAGPAASGVMHASSAKTAAPRHAFTHGPVPRSMRCQNIRQQLRLRAAGKPEGFTDTSINIHDAHADSTSAQQGDWIIPQLSDLKGRRVLITAGSGGMGKATAKAFLDNGARVAILSDDEKGAKSSAEELGAEYVVADLSKPQTTVEAVKSAIQKLGGLDILINCGPNTGAVNLSSDVSFGYEYDKTFEALDEAFNIHVKSAHAAIATAREELAKNKGAVVNVTSVHSPIAIPQTFAYNIAKRAQDALTDNWAFVLAQDGVRCNAVLPAFIDTPSQKLYSSAQNDDYEKSVRGQFRNKHPLARVGAPEEVASVIITLSSKATSFVTGAHIPVDGGALLTSWFNQQFQPDV